MSIRVLLTAAALAAATSTAASAAVIDVFANGAFGARGTMNLAGLIDDDNDAVEDRVRFDFDVLDNVVVDNFSVTGNGYAAGNDLGNIRFGFDAGSGMTFETINVRGNVTNATGFLDNRSFSAGTMFSFFFNETVPGQNTKRAFVNLTFTTDAAPMPSPVPVPAAGLLLLSAIGAGGLAARAKKTA
ncbi:VPLPA-CTERM sorting domain-containing protein [uncultured Jannaschia sp.]|uniref:VPLPA-CTERM sorting domain-containing protein n=1 Tax=uncultured Jannaschia sp. TaxID=293347 RepID=UPI0026138E95|nr:VPLPA-CTERM sorting domain-containing protein [uncultured Jannaschia sp.]